MGYRLPQHPSEGATRFRILDAHAYIFNDIRQSYLFKWLTRIRLRVGQPNLSTSTRGEKLTSTEGTPVVRTEVPSPLPAAMVPEAPTEASPPEPVSLDTGASPPI